MCKEKERVTFVLGSLMEISFLLSQTHTVWIVKRTEMLTLDTERNPRGFLDTVRQSRPGGEP